MRGARTRGQRGALPPAFGSPRDISAKMKGKGGSFIFAANIPAGGSDATNPRHASEPGAQNSSFKNFDPSGARR